MNASLVKQMLVVCVWVVMLYAGNTHAIFQPVEIVPEGDLYISGYYGEPGTYDPVSATYTLWNWGANQVQVNMAVDVDWLSVPTFQTVPGSGEGTLNPRDIEVALKSPQAYDLLPGFHVATVTLTHNGTNGAIPQFIHVILHVKVHLCEAVDNCDLVFTTGGDAEWYGQITQTYDGEDAAQSGAIDNNQETWLETVVDNPGELSFWWKVSSEMGYAPLEFYVNGILISSISGNVPWEQQTAILAVDDPDYLLTGEFVLLWRYAKNRAFALGSDCGWVDQITFDSYDALVVMQAAALSNQHCMIDNHSVIHCGQYTVSNTDPSEDLIWTVSNTAGWIDVSPSGGTLPAGNSAAVDVCFTDAAEALGPGAYTDTLTFRNTVTEYEISRNITVLLSEEPPSTPSNPSPFNGETDVSPGVAVLSWTADDSGGCLTNYTLYFGEDPGALALIYGPGPATSFPLPLLLEDAPYYWQVVAENCCGASDASPVWQFTTGFLDALVYFVPCGGGVNYAATALANLEFSAFSTGDLALFEDMLTNEDRNWEVVIVDAQGGILQSSTLDALQDYYLNRDGRVIFSHSNLDAFPEETHEFLGSMGIQYLDSYTGFENIYAWETEPMFSLPNILPGVLVGTALCPEFGHYVRVRGEGNAVAGYTFGEETDMAAIVVSGDERLVFNAFKPQSITGDQNNNGIPDMVELYENQIVIATPYGCDPDETPPEISLLGANPVMLECGDEYESPGVYAWDFCDGVISDLVDIDVSMLEEGVVGIYPVYYSVADGAGNISATLERTVDVADTTPPMIALLGNDPHILECGYEYESPGVFAWDACDGIISDAVVIDDAELDIHTVGIYTVVYSIVDAESNRSEVERQVAVVDTEPPVITLLGDNPIIIECGDVYEEPGATASDACDGTLDVIIAGDLVDGGIVGIYVVSYTAIDGEGNATELERTVEVIDTTPPIITLLGEASVTVECASEYIDASAEATDICDGDISTDIVVVNPVDTAVVGVYTVTYNVMDVQENQAAEITREVVVVDTLPPEITRLGDERVVVECGDAYNDAGATALDACSGVLTDAIVVGGDEVDVNTVGEYTITYNVADAEENAAVEVTRTVVVEDTTDPILTRLGAERIVVECASVYDDPGATAYDHCDGDITESIVVDNPLDIAVVGEYIITYTVADGQGNEAAVITRTVEVVNTTAPVIALPSVYAPIECGEFGQAFDDIAAALAATAANQCGDITEDIRITGIQVTYPRRGDEITYTVASVNTDLIQAGKIEGFEGEYTGTIAQTIELFQKYFLFKPAIYEVDYAVQEPQPAEATQFIRIDDQCRGPLGCYSCDSCSQQRPLPATVKQMLSDWLLVGLSMLVLAGLANVGRKTGQ